MEIKLDLVLIGRILAGVAIILALLSAIIGAAGARSAQFDIFLYRLVTPLSVGFLILVVTEAWRELGKDRGEKEPPETGE